MLSGERERKGEREREKKRYEFSLFLFLFLDNDTGGEEPRFANKHFRHGYKDTFAEKRYVIEEW